MKVAIITEVSTAAKNSEILSAFKKVLPYEVVNLGMTGINDSTELTYIGTSFMSALLLNNNMVDMVIGGCGTGQGYLNAVLKYPKVVAGLLQDPLDAWLFSQINGGNCVSLALNKGYGWAGDIGLSYLFEKLFKDPIGRGYPESRSESQKASREMLEKIDIAVHHTFDEIIPNIDRSILNMAFAHSSFSEFVKQSLPQGKCREVLNDMNFI